MSSIAPGPLQSVAGAGDAPAVLEQNFEVLTRDIYAATPAYQNGIQTTVIGPPTNGAHALNELWKDAKVGQFRCAAAGTPGTWIQTMAAVVSGLPDVTLYPAGYRIEDAAAGGKQYTASGGAWVATYTSGAVSGIVTLDSATKLQTTVGALTFNTVDSSPINFQIGGANGWRITSDSVWEAVGGGPSTIRTASGNLTIATNAGNGNITMTPHGTGAFKMPTISMITGLPIYANNAAAIAGGLAVGRLYRTGGDPDPVCVVH